MCKYKKKETLKLDFDFRIQQFKSLICINVKGKRDLSLSKQSIDEKFILKKKYFDRMCDKNKGHLWIIDADIFSWISRERFIIVSKRYMQWYKEGHNFEWDYKKSPTIDPFKALQKGEKDRVVCDQTSIDGNFYTVTGSIIPHSFYIKISNEDYNLPFTEILLSSDHRISHVENSNDWRGKNICFRFNPTSMSQFKNIIKDHLQSYYIVNKILHLEKK